MYSVGLFRYLEFRGAPAEVRISILVQRGRQMLNFARLGWTERADFSQSTRMQPRRKPHLLSDSGTRTAAAARPASWRTARLFVLLCRATARSPFSYFPMPKRGSFRHQSVGRKNCSDLAVRSARTRAWLKSQGVSYSGGRPRNRVLSCKATRQVCVCGIRQLSAAAFLSTVTTCHGVRREAFRARTR